MKAFTKRDVKNLLADLQLYCGTIREITDIYGPHQHNCGTFGGKIHTWMDEFNFIATPMMCGDEYWSIQLANPIASLKEGNRLLATMCFPKIHKDPALQQRYQIANLIYHRYNGYSGVAENDRLRDCERELGYDGLATLRKVAAAIVKDFRSYEPSKWKELKTQQSRN
jgi:hypothetical protein